MSWQSSAAAWGLSGSCRPVWPQWARSPKVHNSFWGRKRFLRKKLGRVSFVSFGSLDGFILFNEPALLAGFLKLFSKPGGVYELEWWHKPGWGSCKSVLGAMTSVLTAVAPRQPLALAGPTGRFLTGLWSGYTLCCFKGAGNPNLEWAQDLWVPFYITITARRDV